jgi:hypothetical protein
MPNAVISKAATGEIVAAVTGKRIRVHGYVLVTTTAVAAKWQSASTDLTGAMPGGSNSVISVPHNPDGWFETAVSEALNLNLSGSVQVSGHLYYSVVG